MIGICGIKPQPSLRDLTVDPSAPGVETPGYFHDVPPGQKHGLRPAPADQILVALDLLVCRFLELSSSKESDRARHLNAGLRSRPQPAGQRPAPQGPAVIRSCARSA